MKTNKNLQRRTLKTGLMLLMAMLVACGSGGGSDNDTEPAGNSRTSSYIGTQSPGDVWSWTITMTGGTGIFDATNETLDYEYAGDVSMLPSGFLNLTITSSTDPDTLPGDRTYALEFPDTALLAIPTGGDPLIVCAAVGPCPADDAVYNWVSLLDDSYDASMDDAYGVTAMTIAGSDIDFAHEFFLLDGTDAGTGSSSDFTCADGRLTHPLNPEVFVATPSGLLITDNGPSLGGIVGMQAPAGPIDLADLTAAGREFRGVVFKTSAGADVETEAVWVRTDGSDGLITGNYVDIEAGVETTSLATVVLTTQTRPGVIRMTRTEGTEINHSVIMVNRINGRYFIYGVGTGLPHHAGENYLVIEH
ncbi:MAG: hypothetical protein HKM93_00765 [Desulfobacteraceae bacterium]|nr:hypothetical protein [Desulfobacteraceae bacterium]